MYGFAELVNDGTTDADAVLTADITVNTNVLDSDRDLNESDFYAWTPIGGGTIRILVHLMDRAMRLADCISMIAR